MKIWVALAIAMMPTTVAASEWWFADSASDGSLYFVDMASFVQQGQVVTFWSYSFFNEKHPLFISQKSHDSIDCQKRKSSYTTLVTYFKDGRVESDVSKQAAVEIVPDTVSDAIRLFVCGTPIERKKRGVKLDVSPEQIVMSLRSKDKPETPPQ